MNSMMVENKRQVARLGYGCVFIDEGAPNEARVWLEC